MYEGNMEHNKEDAFFIETKSGEDRYHIVALINLPGKLNTTTIGSVYYSINNDKAVLQHIHVNPMFQHQGYGTMLLKKFEDSCRLMNARQITGIFSPDDVISAKRFYIKNGYTVDRHINKTLDEPQA